MIFIIIPPEQWSYWGAYWFHSVRPSVRPSVCLSVRRANIHVTIDCSVVLPLVLGVVTRQKPQSMGLWYWELMSHPDPVVLPVGTLHSLECFWVSRRIFIYSNHNTNVFFFKTSVRPSVPPVVSALWHLQFWMDSFHISHKWSLPWEDMSHTMTFDLDLYLHGHSALTQKIVSAL